MPDRHSKSNEDSDDESVGNASLVEAPPEPPRLTPNLPLHPDERSKVATEAASYSKAAIASTAVSAFVTPIFVLCLGGYWLDQKLKHVTPYLAMLGVIVGLILGIASLMKVLNRLSK
jgi:hypothetical protein